jgi:hypothetical protein
MSLLADQLRSLLSAAEGLPGRYSRKAQSRFEWDCQYAVNEICNCINANASLTVDRLEHHRNFPGGKNETIEKIKKELLEDATDGKYEAIRVIRSDHIFDAGECVRVATRYAKYMCKLGAASMATESDIAAFKARTAPRPPRKEINRGYRVARRVHHPNPVRADLPGR